MSASLDAKIKFILLKCKVLRNYCFDDFKINESGFFRVQEFTQKPKVILLMQLHIYKVSLIKQKFK